MRPLNRTTWIALAVLFAVLGEPNRARSLGSDLERIPVQRILVPEDEVASAFPPGTDLVVLPEPEFEALLQSAEAAERERSTVQVPELTRARHVARWVDGLLIGRTTLSIGDEAKGVIDIPLVPWTPAIVKTSVGTTSLGPRTGPDGRTMLRADAEEGLQAWIDWELSARPGLSGRSFTLGLPQTAVSELILELPSGLVPKGLSGIRQGPFPASSGELARWTFHGSTGAQPYQLQLEVADDADRPRVWLGGNTRVDILEASVQWRADWSVQVDGSGFQDLSIELAEPLQLIAVEGPGISTYSERRTDQGSRLLDIRLKGDTQETTPITIRAMAPAPDAGPWPVPFAQPVGAEWVGGRSVVRLASGHILETCRALAGPEVTPTADELAGATDRDVVLVFSADRPGPIAELELRVPALDAEVDVSGHVHLGRESSRLEAWLKWSIQSGHVLSLRVGIPDMWEVDQVTLADDGRTPLTWQVETRDDGRSNLVVNLPPALEMTLPEAIGIVFSANAQGTERGGPRRLPQLRTSEARLVDQRWLATTDSETALRPVSAEGLAWLSPDLVGVAIPPEVGTTLGWRWVSSDGQAVVDLEPAGTPSVAEVIESAWIDEERLTVEIRLQVDLGENDLEWLPVLITGANDQEPAWRLSTGDRGQPLVTVDLSPEEQVEAGLPGQPGLAQRLGLPRPLRGATTLLARLERDWDGSGSLPILHLPDAYGLSGRVLILVQSRLLSTTAVAGVVKLEPNPVPLAEPRAGSEAPLGAQNSAFRLAHEYGYGLGRGEPRIAVRTELLESETPGGVIQDALLTSRVTTRDRASHKLTIRLVGTGARTLDITLPQQTTLQNVRIDGRVASPSRRGEAISLPIPRPSSTRPLSTVQIEFEGESNAIVSGVSRVLPPRPEFSLPCLNFTWELITPKYTSGVVDPGSELVSTDPEPPGGYSRRLIGAWPSAHGTLSHASLPPSLVEELAARIPGGDTDGISLWELLVRWDSGARPVIVDRTALATRGWGPRTRLLPRSEQPAPHQAKLGWFRSLGLEVLAIETGLLISTREQARALTETATSSHALTRAIQLALEDGADRSDRFQTLDRWRNEDTRDAQGDPDQITREQGKNVSWFESLGWPDPGSSAVICRSVWARALWSWSAGLFVLAIGISARATSPRRRLWMVIAAASIAIALVGITASSSSIAPVASGVVCGAIGCVAFWLGQSIQAGSMGRGRPGPESSTRRPRGSSLRLESLGLLFVLTSSFLVNNTRSDAQDVVVGGEQTSLLVVVPHDGTGAGLGRVWLRRADADYLKSLGSSPQAVETPAAQGPWTLDAQHELEFREGSIVVESVFDIVQDVAGPLTWGFTVGETRIDTVDLDGVRVPVSVRGGGRTAEIWIGGAGKHRVRIRRVVPVTAGSNPRTLDIPVPRVPSARVRWRTNSGFEPSALVSARGRVTVDVNADTVVRLGPADRLELRPRRPEQDTATSTQTTAEGLLLWDAEPSGDRVRARITYRDPDELSTVRVRLGPGISVRSAKMPSLVESKVEESAEGALWIGQLDPPTSGTMTLTLDLWRPAFPGEPGSVGQPTATMSRSIPRIEPVDVATYVGTLGFRRPAHWLGRLGAATIEGVESVPDELFVQAWGRLPEMSSTLAGAIRFQTTPDTRLLSVPAEPNATIRPSVHLLVQPGRLVLRSQTELIPGTPAPDEYQIRIPSELHVVKVAADGLTDWSRPEPDLLRLRFDRDLSGPRTRTVQLEGWVGVATTPMSPETDMHDLPIPWPEWLGVEQRAGELRISSEGAGSFELVAGASVVPVQEMDQNPFHSAPGGFVPASDVVYSVSHPRELGRIRWSEPGPKVRVTAHSQMTIHPDSSELVSTLRYEVSGGALRTLVFRLPTEWAESARVQAMGLDGSFRSRVENGASELSLELEKPVWGTQIVRIEAIRPFDRTLGLTFPDVVPLMPKEQQQGFETHLMLADASGYGLAPGGSSEVQPVSPSRLVANMPSPPLTSRLFAYTVLQDGWQVSIPPAPDSPGPNEDEANAAVSWADVLCVLRDDGTGLGRASYDLQANPGGFLRFTLPEGLRPLAATVDSRPVRPLRAITGEWFVPLGSREAHRVVIVWNDTGSGVISDDPRSIPMPDLEQAAPPTLLTVYSGSGALDASHPWEPVSRATLEQERLVALSRRISGAIDPGRFDRSSPRDRAELLASLVQFQMQLRSARRASAIEHAQGADAASGPTTTPAVVRLQSIGDDLESTLRAVGLEDFLRSALVRLGDAEGPDPLADVAELNEPRTLLNIRRIGRAQYLRSAGGAEVQEASAVSFRELTPETVNSEQRLAFLLIFGLICFGLAVHGVVHRLGRAVALAGSIALITVVGLAAPLASALAALLVALGWIASRVAPPHRMADAP